MMRRFFAMLALPVILFQGPKNAQFSPPANLVTEIRITCTGSEMPQRTFTSQQSMGRILGYLRSVPFVEDGNEEVPELTPVYAIELTHTTGRVTVYRQMADQYLSKGAGRWHRLDPVQGRYLLELYQSLPAWAESADCILL